MEGKWERIKVCLDSGAIDWVTNKKTASAFKTKDTEASKNGCGYRAANGTSIKNYGERTIEGFTSEWEPVKIAMQVAEVNKTLGSAFRMNQCGNKIVLDGDNSYFVNKKTGKITKVHQEKGQYVFYIWVRAADGKQKRSDDWKQGNRFAALEEEDDVCMDFIRQDKATR